MAHDHGHDDHAPNVKLYMMVFAALMVLTGVTVAISKLELSRGPAIALGLTVAAVKASLVAAIFMHLKGEHKLIHRILLVTVVCGLIVFAAVHDSAMVLPRLTSRMPVAEQKPHHDHPGSGTMTPEPTTTLPMGKGTPMPSESHEGRAH